MKPRELEYSRTFNLGDFQSERITLKVDLDETEDLDESYRTLKARVFKLQQEGDLLEETKKAVDSDTSISPVKQAFPDDLKTLLIFEETKDAIIIKTKGFLGSQNFAKIGAVVRNLGGNWVSSGKESHFKIPKNHSRKQ